MLHWKSQFKQLLHPVGDISVGDFIARLFVLVSGWLGLVVSNFQTIVSVLTGLAILFYTVSNTYVLWKEKILKKSDRQDPDSRSPR